MVNVELDEDISAEIDRSQISLEQGILIQTLRNSEAVKKKVEAVSEEQESRPSSIHVVARRREN